MSELIKSNLKLGITPYRISRMKENLEANRFNLPQIRSHPDIPPVAEVSLAHQELICHEPALLLRKFL